MSYKENGEYDDIDEGARAAGYADDVEAVGEGYEDELGEYVDAGAVGTMDEIVDGMEGVEDVGGDYQYDANEDELDPLEEDISQEDAWVVISAYFSEKGLVRQQLDSFDEARKNGCLSWGFMYYA